MGWFFAGLILGGFVGVMVMCLCFIAKLSDNEK